MRVSGLARVLYFFYSYGGRKFEHVLKHGLRNDLYVVTLGWFVDSVRKNVRLSESLYRVKSAEENGLNTKSNCLVRVNDTENPCLPVGLREDNKRFNSTQQAQLQLSGKESGTRADLALSVKSIYVDSEISDDVRRKENMTADEVVAAIHTDWKHADQLRSAYVSKESLESGNVQFRRISFLGTRRSFEMLKRVGGDNNSNVYELLIRA